MHRKPRETTKPSQAEIYRLATVTRISPNTVRRWLAGLKVQPANQWALEKAAKVPHAE
jgi:hypothetical protein